MKIIDLLDDKSIRLNAEVHSKKEALDTLVDLMDASGKLNDIETYRKGVYAREEEGSTGIGEGIAIPHCKSAAVNQAGLAAMVAPKGVEFDSLDGEPANRGTGYRGQCTFGCAQPFVCIIDGSGFYRKTAGSRDSRRI